MKVKELAALLGEQANNGRGDYDVYLVLDGVNGPDGLTEYQRDDWLLYAVSCPDRDDFVVLQADVEAKSCGNPDCTEEFCAALDDPPRRSS